MIKFKRLHKDATLPKFAKPGDAGRDLTAVSMEYYDGFIEYATGIAVEIPDGHVGLIFPRSSVTNKDLLLKNAVGVIDSKYRGEIKFRFWRTKGINSMVYGVGDRIGQLVIMPINTEEECWAEELSNTERSTGGWGSTGV